MKRLTVQTHGKRKTLTYDNTFNDMHTVGVLLSTTADHYSKRGLEVNGKDLSDESAYLQYLSMQFRFRYRLFDRSLTQTYP